MAPSFGYSFRFSTTQVTCAWITHGTYDLTSVSDRTVVPDPREGSGDLIVHDYMRALSCSHEVSTTSPDTAACEGQDFRRTIHSYVHFEGHGIWYGTISYKLLSDQYCTITMHCNLPTVNVKMMNQDTAMIGARTPTTGKCTLDLESDTLPYRPPWPRLFLD